MNSNKKIIGLGLQFENKRQYTKAAECYREAAGQSYAAGHFHLGELYKNGLGVTQDDHEAVSCYKEAAWRGSSPAKYSLGWMYENGRGVEMCMQQALYWYRQAAKNDYPKAFYKLGNFCSDSKDYSEAIHWYNKAAHTKHCVAQYKLAMMYLEGKGAHKNVTKFWDFLKLAAENHYKQAVTMLNNLRAIHKAIYDNSATEENLITEANLILPPPKNKHQAETYYHLLAADGKLAKLPPQVISNLGLTCQDTSGRTPLHIAAENKALNLIPPDCWHQVLLDIKDNQGNSVIHTAIVNGGLHDIPKELLTAENINIKNNRHISPGRLLVEQDLAHCISKDIALEIPELADITLKQAISKKDFTSPVFLDSRLLSSQPLSVSYNATWYHFLAQKGLLDKLPHSSHTYDFLMLRDKELNTPLHYAARHKQLDGIPRYFFTQENLLATNNKGSSVADLLVEGNLEEVVPEEVALEVPLLVDIILKKAIDRKDFESPLFYDADLLASRPLSVEYGATWYHLLAEQGLLGKLPHSAHTHRLLMLSDDQRETPLHYAAHHEHLKTIPKHFYTEENVTAKNKQGVSLVELIIKLDLVSLLPEDLQRKNPTIADSLLQIALEKRNFNSPFFEDTDLLSSEPLCRDFKGSWYHLLAAEGLLNQLPDNSISGQLLTLRTPQKENLLHLAVNNLQLDNFPKQLITNKALLAKNSAGSSVADLIIEKNQIDFIPEDIQQHNPIIADFLLKKAIDKQDFNSPVFLKGKLLSAKPKCIKVDGTWYHQLAKEGLLIRLPKPSLSPKLLELKNKQGESPLHVAIAEKQLKMFPQQLITNEALASRNNGGVSALDLVTSYDEVHHIPKTIRQSNPQLIDYDIKFDIENQNYHAPIFNDESLLASYPYGDTSGCTWCHILASKNLLTHVSDKALSNQVIKHINAKGKTALHIAAELNGIKYIPKAWLSTESLLAKDDKGRTVFHTLACQTAIGGLSPKTFTPSILLTSDETETSVADCLEEHDNTKLLPTELQWYSKKHLQKKLSHLFKENYLHAQPFWNEYASQVINRDEFLAMRRKHVQQWASERHNLKLDDEQVEAVACNGNHVSLTARAGSGKTHTLVARILFQIEHCGIAADTILALAFNREAALEIKDRLQKHLDHSPLPNVMTFHSLAWRIVKPSEQILLDSDGSDENKVLSQTIKKIIERRFADTDNNTTLQRLIGIQWESSLQSLIEQCLDIPPAKRIQQIQNAIKDSSLDGKRVKNSIHKWICNFLIHYDFDYTYQQAIHYYGGDEFLVDFIIKRPDQTDIVINLNSPCKYNKAVADFKRSDKKDAFDFITLQSDGLNSYKGITRIVKKELTSLSVQLNKLEKDELWEKIKDKTITQFTKSTQNFISRCQKEMVRPDDLERLIHESQETSKCRNITELQTTFWNEALAIYRNYETALQANQQTDFDRLMMQAADLITKGQTTFVAGNGTGNLCNIKHFLIDEFQDFSHLFNALRSSFLEANPDALFFCVGDDWQAINRFAGSNVRYFHEFPEQFPGCRKLQLRRNYRSCEVVVDEGNQIMRNRGELSIAENKFWGTVSFTRLEAPINLTTEEEILHDSCGTLGCLILRIAQSSDMPLAYLRDPNKKDGSKKKVAILSLYKNINGKELQWWKKQLCLHLPQECHRQIEFSTTHGYKGKEAETVILLQPENYPRLHPDSMFNTIFGETYDDIELDERRLLYVGATRAKSHLIYLTNKEFIESDTSTYPYFLPNLNHCSKLVLNTLQPFLLSGQQALIQVTNNRKFTNAGTYPMRQELNDNDFHWKADKKAWVRNVATEQTTSSRSVLALLQTFPWTREIEDVNIQITNNNLTYRYALDKGEFTRLDAQLNNDQRQELNLLNETIGVELAKTIESVLLDLKEDWPEFGFEAEDSSCMLEIAWPHDKIGLYLPDDDIQYFKKQGWRLIEINNQSDEEWEEILLRRFSRKSSTLLKAEGIYALYHFTDNSNLESIRKNGILSNHELELAEIAFKSGGDLGSIQRDRSLGLDDYVHLCLAPHHPMAYAAQSRDSSTSVQFMRIDPKVLDTEGVKASLKVSTSGDAEVLDLKDAMKRINWDSWKQYWNAPEIDGFANNTDQDFFKIELLIPKHVPQRLLI